LVLNQAFAQERVQVPSLDQRDGLTVQMPGFWFASPAGGAAPAMLLLHGCGGPYGAGGQLSVRMKEIAARLNAMGVGALVTDSLTPRGEKELCTQRTGTRNVTQTQRRRDALGALQWLARQPGVDAARLGLMGWSNGGSTVLASINHNHPEVAASVVRPSLSVAFYPGCETDLKRGYRSPVPLLLLVGELDDWTPAAPCKELARTAGAPAPDIVVYPGAYHGFDSSVAVRLRKDVPNGVNPGQGVHVGGNPAARSASAQRVDDYLRSQWKLAAD
jgi:dienelactone hydrolase